MSVRLAICLLGVLALSACGGDAIGTSDVHSTESWAPSPVRAGNLRFVSFNIRNFPSFPVEPTEEPRPEPVHHRSETDEQALLDVLTRLDFDVMGVQEIVEPATFQALLGELSARTGRSYTAVFAENHAGNPQHVGVVVDAQRVLVLASAEHEAVDTTGTLRPGLSVRLRSTAEGGVDLGVMVLHLASGSSVKRAELRAAQASASAAIVAEEIAQSADGDYLVLGDLNTARAEQEYPQLDAAFAAHAPLARQANELPCSSYYTSSATNPVVRPALIDHVYAAGLGERDLEVPLTAGTHCAQKRCERFESTDASTGSTFYAVSDHCPVYFEVVDRDDDPEPVGE